MRRFLILKGHGYKVSIVQNPTISLEDDVAVTKRILATQDGPTILVGHSYGGAVITEAGNHPKVSALVYIAAFAPDKGESVGSLIKDPPPGAPVPPILPRKTAFCSSTGRSFLLLSQPTWSQKKPRSWLIPKCPSARVLRSLRSREVTPSTYRSQKRSQILLNRLQRR